MNQYGIFTGLELTKENTNYNDYIKYHTGTYYGFDIFNGKTLTHYRLPMEKVNNYHLNMKVGQPVFIDTEIARFTKIDTIKESTLIQILKLYKEELKMHEKSLETIEQKNYRTLKSIIDNKRIQIINQILKYPYNIKEIDYIYKTNKNVLTLQKGK